MGRFILTTDNRIIDRDKDVKIIDGRPLIKRKCDDCYTDLNIKIESDNVWDLVEIGFGVGSISDKNVYEILDIHKFEDTGSIYLEYDIQFIDRMTESAIWFDRIYIPNDNGGYDLAYEVKE